ncbi:hypothetical protein ACFLW1_00565 [Chloroflexota bacterium]
MAEQPQEDGMEELLRLSQQMKAVEHKQDTREQERRRKTEVVQGLRDIKISVALSQLQMFALSEVVEVVEGLKSRPGTQDLRKMILDLVAELESGPGAKTSGTEASATLARQIKTLAVLVELLFSLE